MLTHLGASSRRTLVAATVLLWYAVAFDLRPADAKPHSGATGDWTDGLSLSVSCGLRTCDLRTHYCDHVINNCARCDDDCHSGRISGNQDAVEYCQRVCKGEPVSR